MNEIIAEFIIELRKAAPEDYERVKLEFMSYARQTKQYMLFNLLKAVFEVTEKNRPLLIEMKEEIAL